MWANNQGRRPEGHQGEIVRFIDDVNAARRARYGLLIQRAEERSLPADWPHRFFKKSTQSPKKVKTP